MELENIKSDYHEPNSEIGASKRISEDKGHPLDSEESIKKLEKINDWWYETRVAHSDNRVEQSIDDDFVDGLQWFDDDANELRERGQQPLVYNEVKPTVEWVTGTEKRTKIEWNVFPREDGDRDLAEVKTKLLKYVADVNKMEFRRSLQFEDAVRSGDGWMEYGISGDAEQELIFAKNESWRNIWVDHTSVEFDLSDARYLFRSKLIDLDIATTMFPDREQSLYSASEALSQLPLNTQDDFFDSQLYYNSDTVGSIAGVSDSGSYHLGRRQVVRLIECWYREPTKLQVLRGPWNINGKEYDPDNEFMKSMVEQGRTSIVNTVRMKCRIAVFCQGAGAFSSFLCQDLPSPYRHNRFPFVRTRAYIRKRDNMSYGIVRNSRDPQMDLNKRKSKALFLLSVNRTIMDKGAVDDMDQFEEEVSRPDAVIEKNQGKELTIETNIQLADAHIALLNQDSDYIRQLSGVTGENLGMETNATSGKAIVARQNQGTVVTASLFDSHRLSAQLGGDLVISLIEQFYDYEKVVRITGEEGAIEFMRINYMDEMTGEIMNDITRSQSDFKVAEQDYRESLRMAMFEQMMAMLGQLDSTVALNLLDMVIEFSDLPGKDAMVRRIRSINGQPDPKDQQSNEMEQQIREQKAQEEQQQAELIIREAIAKIKEIEAKTSSERAKAQSIRLDSMLKALEAQTYGENENVDASEKLKKNDIKENQILRN